MATAPQAKPSLVLDPNTLSPDGSVQMAQWSPSPDGRHLAYTLAPGGSDVQDIHVRNLKTGQDLPTVVRNVKSSGLSWTKDGRGFFYSRYKGTEASADFADALEFHQVWYHALDGDTADRLVFERPEHPKDFVGGEVSDDGRWLYLATASGSMGNRLWVADLGSAMQPDLAARPVTVAPEEDAFYQPLGVVGKTLYLYTTYQAPRGRVVALTIGETDRAKWRTVVPETKDVIDDGGTALVGDHISVVYLADVQGRVRLFALDGTPKGEIALPEPGSVSGLQGRNDGREIYFSFTSFLRPATVYRYDLKTRALEPFHPPTSTFDSSKYETRALFYTSQDGTRVPLFVTLRKGTKLDGSHPTMLFGTAASTSPWSRTSRRPWRAGSRWAASTRSPTCAARRVRLRVAQGRHEGAQAERVRRLHRCGRVLVREKYTAPSRLAIRGGSNGGLLVAATMIQRPDLFAVALPAVGVLDMLRYHKFSVGPFWAADYGSSDDPKALDYLLAYSPLHNLKPGTCYPATLITTADRDDRVVPSHSFQVRGRTAESAGLSASDADPRRGGRQPRLPTDRPCDR